MIDKSIVLHLYNRLLFGPKKIEFNDYDFRQRFKELKPVVFLSTGRCGTKWLTERLEGSEVYVPIHHPTPVMRVQAKMMFDYDFESIDKNTLKLLSEIFLAGREELFVAAKRADKELAITDSRGTFFAYVIASLFPESKFIFVHRNPLEVIQSGLKRGWYSLENESELNRIVPQPSDPHYEKWDEFSDVQRIAWLWQKTNSWILEFLKTVPDERKHVIGFNDWNTDSLHSMFEFMQADVSKKEIEGKLGVRSNAQRTNMSPNRTKWTKESEKEAIQICGDIALKLNYNLES